MSDNYRPLKRADYSPYLGYRDSTRVLDTSFVRAVGYQSRSARTRTMLWLVQHSRLAQLINRVRHLSRRDERQRVHLGGGTPGHEVGLRDEVQIPPRTA